MLLFFTDSASHQFLALLALLVLLALLAPCLPALSTGPVYWPCLLALSTPANLSSSYNPQRSYVLFCFSIL